MSRGTEWLVPMPPGLVRLAVVPWKSETSSLPSRAFLTIASYACQNCAKFMVSAALMDGTRSWRSPLAFFVSIARPKLTCSGFSWTGLPFSSMS